MSIKVFDANGAAIEVRIFNFKGGEVQVRVDSSHVRDYYKIRADITCSDDVMALLLVTDALRHMDPAVKIDLDLPYVPYARQDRVMNPGEALSIKVFCDLINAQNYNSVFIWDPHSDVTPALLKRVAVMPQEKLLMCDMDLIIGELDYTKYLKSGLRRQEAGAQAYKDRMDNIVLVSPDAGANKKIFKVAQECGFKHVVRADKERNVETNEITRTVVYSDHIGDKDFLIVDDICDGGRTFIELAKVLRPLTNGKIILYVTHGIFSYGLGPFKGLIDEVYCAHSFGKFVENVNLMTGIE
jgi:ribose-phosphate pyrophosphokinase